MLRLGLRQQISLYFIPLIIFSSLVFLSFFLIKANSLLNGELLEMGSSLVKSLSYSSKLGIASEDIVFLKPYVDDIFTDVDVALVMIYNEQGDIIASKKKLDVNEKISPEVMQEIAETKQVIIKRGRAGDNEEFYDFYAPILISETPGLQSGVEGGKLGGFARLGLSSERIKNEFRVTFLIDVGIAVLIIILGVSGTFLLGERITKPLQELTEGVRAIGSGQLDYRIKVKRGGEIEELGKSFNQMAEDIKGSHLELEESRNILEIKVTARTKELQDLTKDLEDKVAERTKELQIRINELERFRRLTVGRELRMIDLKKELKRKNNPSRT